MQEYAKKENSEVVKICAKIEEELADLTEEEKQEFLEDLGIKESGLDKLIKSSYKLLGLSTFLTSGKDEVRAWTFKQSEQKVKEAGKLRLEGKDYIMQDGDICLFRFNV